METTITINGITQNVTCVEDLDEFTKVELMSYSDKNGLKAEKGKTGKVDYMALVFAKLLSDAGYATPEETAKSECGDDPNSGEFAGPDPEPTTDPEPEVFVPNMDNAPAGMVYCYKCKKHVPKKSCFPTSDPKVYFCKSACNSAKSTTEQAKKLTEAAKAARQPKVKTPSTRKTLFPDTGIIAVGDKVRSVKVGSLSEKTYNVLLGHIGKTVKEFCAVVDAMNKAGECGAITGRSELAHSVTHGFVKVTEPTA